MKYSLITVCPKCKKEVSEFALLCSNCGYSLSEQPPVKVDSASLKKKIKRHISKTTMSCAALSVIVGAFSIFVLTQALLAFKIVRNMATINRLVLFRNAVEQSSFSCIGIGIIASVVIFITSVITLVCLALKSFRAIQKT